MDDPLFPWWSVLLLGMWAAALMVWLHPAVHRELRLWAGLSTLVYLVLIFMALGGNPLAGLPGPAPSTNFRAIDVVLTVCTAISLASSIWMLGPICLRNRRLCYLMLTIANAVICVGMRQYEIAIGLIVVALVTSKPMMAELARTGIKSFRGWLIDFTRFNGETTTGVPRGEFWLIGGLGLILSLAILGTVSHALRIETIRSTADSRHPALPNRDQLNRVLAKGSDGRRDAPLIDMALGVRADVVVLMVVIIFLRMAMTFTAPSITAVPDNLDADETAKPP